MSTPYVWEFLSGVLIFDLVSEGSQGAALVGVLYSSSLGKALAERFCSRESDRALSSWQRAPCMHRSLPFFPESRIAFRLERGGIEVGRRATQFELNGPAACSLFLWKHVSFLIIWSFLLKKKFILFILFVGLMHCLAS